MGVVRGVVYILGWYVGVALWSLKPFQKEAYELIISMAAKESAPGAGDGGTKYEALQFVSDKITNCFSVDPLLVASSLFAKKMIPQSVLEAMLLGGRTNREKATQLMGAVLTDVKNLPGYFEAFMDVLQEQSLEGLVELIEHQLKV